MLEQLEIILYQYKKQNNLDVYSPLDYWHLQKLINGMWMSIERIEKTEIKYGKD